MAVPTGADYDAIVIGAGLGGLSAGACLARGGKRVLLVERQAGVGGNAHAFNVGRTPSTPRSTSPPTATTSSSSTSTSTRSASGTRSS